ncbi:hypothetical protein E2320_012956 [Naja naja]|nr:hypothetical protein E2320_012956 [Naja naja]
MEFTDLGLQVKELLVPHLGHGEVLLGFEYFQVLANNARHRRALHQLLDVLLLEVQACQFCLSLDLLLQLLHIVGFLGIMAADDLTVAVNQHGELAVAALMARLLTLSLARVSWMSLSLGCRAFASLLKVSFMVLSSFFSSPMLTSVVQQSTCCCFLAINSRNVLRQSELLGLRSWEKRILKKEASSSLPPAIANIDRGNSLLSLHFTQHHMANSNRLDNIPCQEWVAPSPTRQIAFSSADGGPF